MRATPFGIDAAARLYNLEAWGGGFFRLADSGELAVAGPQGQLLPLPSIAAKAREQGLALPLLLRFNHILGQRAAQLVAAFDDAARDLNYAGQYTPVYPIKVNQQGAVVRELVGNRRLGLEAGSKPELLAVLGVLPAGRRIVCNGYKDAAYVRLALIAEALGHPTTLVIEKLSEIRLIAQVSADMGIPPRLGLRVRLASVSKGHWQNSGGDKSKFGLSAPQLQSAMQELIAHDLLAQLELLHFHLGSQVANLRDIRSSVREAARFFVELSRMGAPLRVVDVGGGLGVDYDGTASRASFSINYSMRDYARVVTEALAQAAEAADLAAPDIVSESGRALTAQHAVLVTNVIDAELLPSPDLAPLPKDAPALLQDLQALLDSPMRPLECLEEARLLLEQAQAAFAREELNLAERAQAEELWVAICRQLQTRLDHGIRTHREALDELREQLADKLFCNFSLFQSLPDAWAIGQVFPIMPLQRLHEAPTRMGLIRDLTCDSDGRIDHYVDRDGLESTLPIHALRAGEDYLLGFFLVGAYQEILGDMHNLFGDTDAANVVFDAHGDWQLTGLEQGDTAEELLDYVHLGPAELRRAYSDKLASASLTAEQRTSYLASLEGVLSSTTYLA